jgi:hypothetical protein
MRRFDERTEANLDVVLEDVSGRFPTAVCDHESRKFIAARLLRAAQRGKRTLGAPDVVARRAMQILSLGRPG